MTVWGGGVSYLKLRYRKIANIQKRALKLFTNSENVSRPLNYDKMITLHLMRKFQAIVYNNSSPYFLFKMLNQIPKFSWQQKLIIPRHHKSMSKNQFFYNAIKQCALPVEPKLPLPPDTFKQWLKYLMSNWFYIYNCTYVCV